MIQTKKPEYRLSIIQRLALVAALICALAGCAAGGSTVTRLSENQGSRVKAVVIHFTTADFAESLNILTEPSSNPVSSHYLVPEPDDPSYDGRDLQIYRLVPETRRAWHAGRSYWGGKIALNDQSIGIELVNRAYCYHSPLAEGAVPGVDEEAASLCFYPDFSAAQIELLIDLLDDIHERHPGIAATDIVGHADIAPGRKVDPGPRFPWQRLYRRGYGAWYEDEAVIRFWEQFRHEALPLINVQRALHAYGYDIEASGIEDRQTRDVLRAFQMHFVPAEVSGDATPETVATLFALIAKYFPERLADLLEAEGPVIDEPLVAPMEMPGNAGTDGETK